MAAKYILRPNIMDEFLLGVRGAVLEPAERALVNMRSGIKNAFQDNESMTLSDAAQEISDFINAKRLRTGGQYVDVPKPGGGTRQRLMGGTVIFPDRRSIPRAIRNLDTDVPLNYNFVDTSTTNIKNMSKQNRARLESNIESILNREVDGKLGDPNFYWDLNRLLAESAGEVDPAVRALTFAPFSMGTAVRRNTRLWQRFMENPEQFPGGISGESSLTAKGAYKKALKILMKENPKPEDLAEAGHVLKIGSFGENIMSPGLSNRATMDRHAVRNAMGLYLPDDIAPIPDTTAAYKVFEEAFQNVAKKRGMAPHEVQSATWDTWRRLMQKSQEDAMIAANDFVDLEVSRIATMPLAARRDALRALMSELNDTNYIDTEFLKGIGL